MGQFSKFTDFSICSNLLNITSEFLVIVLFNFSLYLAPFNNFCLYFSLYLALFSWFPLAL